MPSSTAIPSDSTPTSRPNATVPTASAAMPMSVNTCSRPTRGEVSSSSSAAVSVSVSVSPSAAPAGTACATRTPVRRRPPSTTKSTAAITTLITSGARNSVSVLNGSPVGSTTPATKTP
jgi:hypothetical protein